MTLTAYTADGRQKSKGQSWAPQAVLFNAKRTTDLAFAASTYIGPLTFDQENDPYGFFDGSKFLPKIAGWYEVRTQLTLSGMAAYTPCEIYIRKNGSGATPSPTLATWSGPSRSDGWVNAGCSDTIYFNGTTDYVEVLFWAQAVGSWRGTSSLISTFSAELVAASVGVAPEPWHIVGNAGEPAFQNGWVNYDARVARFFKDPHNIVRLNGVIKSGTIGNSAFTLPVGYRPGTPSGSNFNFPVPSNSVFGIVFVGGDGGVNMNNVSNLWVDLSSIAFRAEQ